jgi:acyl-CoA thioesterase-2
MPEGMPDPETLPSAGELLGPIEHPVAQYWATQRPFDIRHVDSPIYMSVEGEKKATQAVWMKSLSPLPDDQIIQRAALVYASDYTILEPIYRKHGIPWSTPGLKAASLDHAMWFHRDANINDWVLYVQESPSAQGGRGLSFGKIYTREGMLIASVAQEGMVRTPQIG